MHPCSACHRHVRPAATACPFCGAALQAATAPQASTTATAWALGLAVFAACGGKDGDSATDSGTSSSTDGATSTSGATDDPTTTTATPTTSGATSDASTGCTTACASSTEAAGFIYGAPDAGQTTLECDLQAEDCPDGQKCMPFVDGPGTMWNALKCVPVDAAPVPVGEACNAPGGGLDGLDNCEKHVMCFEVQGNQGVCRAMCDSGTCDDGFNCFVGNDDVLQLCLPECDINMPDCPPGHGCIPVPDGGVCAPGG